MKAKHSNGNGMGTPLAVAASTWPTPAASEARLGFQDRSDPEKKGTQVSLSTMAMIWSTPRASDGEKGGPNQRFISGGMPLPAQASDFSLPAPATSTHGETSSHSRRSLNPLFTEWLMGWPPGWTMIAITPDLLTDGTRRGSSGCACSATALSRFRADMRSALSSLGTPPAAPPEQPSFL
jgi:hypothetical protein